MIFGAYDMGEKDLAKGLTGRNGAGKTTVLRLISGLAKPSGGNVCLFEKNGHDTIYAQNRISANRIVHVDAERKKRYKSIFIILVMRYTSNHYNKTADCTVYFALGVLLLNVAFLYTNRQYNFYRGSRTFNGT